MSPGHSYTDFNISGGQVHVGDRIYYGVEAEHLPVQECLQSLAFQEMNDRKQDIKTAAEGTCGWLLRHRVYIEWASRHRGLLWIQGKPGSGKSTLLKCALRHVQAAHGAGDGAIILPFFFHGRGSELQKTPLGLLRSLLHQLLIRVPELLLDLVNRFEFLRKTMGTPGVQWQWHPQELLGFLESALPKILETLPVVLLIDALDECGKENAIDLVDMFMSISERLPSTGLHFAICFTCRHYPVLNWGCGLKICVEDENHGDISTYLQIQLSMQQPEVIGVIMDRASGVFLWAYLVVRKVLELCREGATRTVISAEIQNTPEILDDLYHELTQQMKYPSNSLKLIQWICFASRPLSTKELRWAMAIDADCSSRTLQQYRKADDYIADDQMLDRKIKTFSCGLAEIVPSSNGQVVQFIHQSVKEFFVEKGLLVLNRHTASPDVARRLGHFRLFRICICYLAMEEIARATRRIREELISDFPFLRYATTFWVVHLNQSDTGDIPQHDILGLFSWPSNVLVELWQRMYRIISQYSIDCPPAETSLLHVASRYQVVGLLKAILKRADQIGYGIDAKDSQSQTPLSCSARYGHAAVTKLLLETGKVKVNTKDGSGRTPLSWAAAGGNEAVVKLLLVTGKAQIDAKDSVGWAPLSWAAEGGHEAVVKLLLEAGTPEVDMEDGSCWTRAARNARKVIAKLLHHMEKTDVDVDAKDSEGRAPLSRAAAAGHAPVVRLLLETGKVDVDAKDKNGEAPLLRACRRGHGAIVKLLLDSGMVDVNTKDKFSCTPLLYAARGGYDASVELLLNTGNVDIDGEDRDGRTPLSWAAAGRHEATVKLLLDTGKVNVDAKDQNGRTPLSWAAASGHDTIVKLLLGRGNANATVKDEDSQTALSHAVLNGHEAVAKFLLDTDKVGVDVNAKITCGWTLLSLAARRGHEAIVKLLLETDTIDVDKEDGCGWTPLSYAARDGHETVVKLLLNTGKVNADIQDEEGRTPLLWAAAGGFEAVVKLLLNTGMVDANVKDKKGRTPLLWAVKGRHKTVVKLLREVDMTEIDAKHRYGHTLLSCSPRQA